MNRFVGGGHKQRLRIVDFHRREAGEHDVVRIEYDPGRSAHIALIRRRDAEVVDADEGARLAEKVIERPADWMPSTHKPDNNPRELLKVRGGWSYILAPDGLRAGDVVRSYRSGVPSDLVEGLSADSTDNLDVDPSSPQSVNPPTKASSSTSSSRALGLLRTLTLKVGNVLPIELCPPGTIVHNISLTSGGKMQLCRSAGTFGQIVAHGIGKKEVSTVTEEEELLGAAASNQKAFKGWTLVKLQSGEVRKLHPGCAATVGTVSNKEHQQEQIGKAGRSRWLGRRPRVRGVAMNACDHPHGGGRGKSKGNKDPRSVWGWLTKGKRTRRPKDRDGNKMYVTGGFPHKSILTLADLFDCFSFWCLSLINTGLSLNDLEAEQPRHDYVVDNEDNYHIRIFIAIHCTLHITHHASLMAMFRS